MEAHRSANSSDQTQSDARDIPISDLEICGFSLGKALASRGVFNFAKAQEPEDTSGDALGPHRPTMSRRAYERYLGSGTEGRPFVRASPEAYRWFHVYHGIHFTEIAAAHLFARDSRLLHECLADFDNNYLAGRREWMVGSGRLRQAVTALLHLENADPWPESATCLSLGRLCAEVMGLLGRFGSGEESGVNRRIAALGSRYLSRLPIDDLGRLFAEARIRHNFSTGTALDWGQECLKVDAESAERRAAVFRLCEAGMLAAGDRKSVV